MFTTSVVGSFPRPKWLIEAFDKHDKGQLSDDEFNLLLEDAIKLTIKEQELAGIDVITDGEQERTSFVSFVGQKIPGFSLVDIKKLRPDAMDILKRAKTQLTYTRAVAKGPIKDSILSLDDFRRARNYTTKPIKVTLPAPYLVMWETWHHTISKDLYPTPEDLGYAFAKILREEILRLREAKVDYVQLDEPMLGDLTEAGEQPDRYRYVLGELYGHKYRGFKEELRLAVDLLNAAIKGIDGVRLGMHMDRWPNPDSPFYDQGYERFLPDLLEVKVWQLVLEYTSKGCGDPVKIAKALSSSERLRSLAFGCVSVRDRRVETPEEIAARVEPVVPHLETGQTWLVPDCGFAPGMFRGYPRHTAFAKLRSMAKAAQLLREKYGAGELAYVEEQGDLKS